MYELPETRFRCHMQPGSDDDVVDVPAAASPPRHGVPVKIIEHTPSFNSNLPDQYIFVFLWLREFLKEILGPKLLR